MTLEQNSRRFRIRRAFFTVCASLTVIAVATPGTVEARQAPQAVVSAEVASLADGAAGLLERWSQTGVPADYARYAASREAVVVKLAEVLGLDPSSVRASFAHPKLINQHVALLALSQLGVPYRRNRSEPGVGFDCSGLVLWAYGRAGIDLPRYSGDQIRSGGSVSRGEAELGDLAHYPGHIGMYLGNGILLHAPRTGRTVEMRALSGRSMKFADVTPESGPNDPGPAMVMSATTTSTTSTTSTTVVATSLSLDSVPSSNNMSTITAPVDQPAGKADRLTSTTR